MAYPPGFAQARSSGSPLYRYPVTRSRRHVLATYCLVCKIPASMSNPLSTPPGPASSPTETRERILLAAGQVFARKGYRAASLDTVAQAAGLTKGAIYWHFRSKNDLFFALLDAKFAAHTAPVAEELRAAAQADDPRHALINLLKANFSRWLDDPDWPPLFMEFVGLARDNEIRERLARFRKTSLELITSYIQLMQDAGLAPRDRDAAAQARFWTALFDGLLLGWIIDPPTDLNAQAVEIVDLLQGGIVPSSALEKF